MSESGVQAAGIAQTAAGPRRRATYRVQLNADFDFAAAAAITDYLADLGISHLYCSPSLRAVAGSRHGYDVVDPTRLSPELGGEEGYRQLVAITQDKGLQLLLDIVPNHMAANPSNPWWWDVLEDGERSDFAAYFDVDWSGALDPRMRGRVLAPLLGDQVGRAVERGELRCQRRRDGHIVLRYHDQSAPLSLPSLLPLLRGAWEASGSGVLGAVVHGVAQLSNDPARRSLERSALWSELGHACIDDDTVAAAIDAQLDTVNQDPAALDALLEAQPHRLAWWRVALREANYRRFFDITSLVGVRVEDPAVFEATHRLVLDMLARGDLDGLRIDHVDGLRLPRAYLHRLRQASGPDAWLVVEKILGAEERLPAAWPVQGTTGYEFAALTTRVFTDPRGEAPLTALLGALGGPVDADAESRLAKLQVMTQTLAADLERVTLLLRRACDQRARHRDHTLDTLRAAVRELVAAMPVYRTYAEPGARVDAADEERVRFAVAAAKLARPEIDTELFDMLGDVIIDNTLRDGDDAATDFVLHLQQLCAAVTAKGVEDTAFYRAIPLVSLNEVGGGPRPWSVTVAELHAHNAETQRSHPFTLLATTTHDTKRSEDVRARLSLLSEIPERWARTVHAWHDRNARYRSGAWPDGVMEYLLYQSLVGAWPIERERMVAYMDKASREAKEHTSWIDPSPDYDAALRNFVNALYDDADFLAAVAEFTGPLVAPGRVNALAMALLKLTSPGVPDVYQGCELWTLTLVDPDNRRPVDYALRRQLLERSRTVSAAQAWSQDADSGLPKLLLTRRALHLRARQPHLFGEDGAYRPLERSGTHADHVISFARGAEPGAVTVVPRLPLGVGGDWRDTAVQLPEGEWFEQLCGHRFTGSARVAALLADFPVALLARQPFEEA